MEAAALLIIAMYLGPSLVGYARGHKSRHGILALNILLGWTMLGWIVALVWALSNKG